MDELKFASKCLGFAIALLILMQIKVKDSTIEQHVESSLINTKVSHFVNRVAHGGVKLIKDGYGFAKESFLEWKNYDGSRSSEDTKSSATAADVSEDDGVKMRWQLVAEDTIASTKDKALDSAVEISDKATKIYESNLEAVRKIERLEKKTHSELELSSENEERAETR